MATFSTRLQELKETKKLLQKDAAKALDVPLRTYQRYEHGQQEPQLSTLIRMADFYGVTLDYLAGRSDQGGRRRADGGRARGLLGPPLFRFASPFLTSHMDLHFFFFFLCKRRCHHGEKPPHEATPGHEGRFSRPTLFFLLGVFMRCSTRTPSWSPGAGPDAHHPGPEQAPEERTPMCGVPYHSCESYIARLIAKGYKVAICEQMEDPALAKGLVDRDIIRIITPGTVIDSSMLEEGKTTTSAGCTPTPGGAGAVPVRHLHRRVLCHLLSGGGGGHGPPEKRAGPLLSPREAVLSDGAWSLEGLPQLPAGAAGLPL